VKYTARDIIEHRKELWRQYRNIEQDREFIESVADYLVSDDGEAIREEIGNNPEYLIEMAFLIVNKDKQTVPFFLNDVQHSFINDLNQAKEDYRAGRRLHLKFLILKGRQQGFTSVITAYQLATAIVTKNFAGFTLADNGDNTTTIFEDKAKFPYDNLPEQIKPTEKYNTRRELHFEKLNSRWRVSTAGTKEVGRSKTLNLFHGSEAAFWPYGIQTVLTGLGEALTKDAIQILESTANGPNEFQEMWDGAVRDKNNYEAKFYQWWLTPEYRLDFESLEAKLEFRRKIDDPDYPIDREKDIFTEIRWLLQGGRDIKQAYWYYNKWKDIGDKVKQEYPNTPEQAFQAGEGIAFPEFSYDIHVCKPFPIPSHWRRWRGLDNGYDDPFAWYWLTVSEDGKIFVYREFSRSKEDPKITYSDQAKKVKELSTYTAIEDGEEKQVQEPIDYTVAGKDAWATHHRDESGKTLIDYYQEGGITGFIPAITDRRMRKAVWHEYLKPYFDEVTGKWTAKIQIFDTCKFLIDSLPRLVKDEKDPEKVAEGGIDHWYDACGYAILAYHANVSKPPKAEEPPIAKRKNALAKRVTHQRRKLS
jgi:hypothetical protein